MSERFFIICDILAILVINAIVWSSLYIQFAYFELPCPLCLGQRIGLLGISFGYVLNLYFGTSARHYAISIIAALLTASVAIIQILLHIVPETGNYGSPFLGLHLYTWVFIICCLFAFGNLILITLLKSAMADKIYKNVLASNYICITIIAIIPLILCILVNAVSAFAQCGLNKCPPDPTSYWIKNFLKPDKVKKHHSKNKL
ncbi:MAG: disulfide bond formation protein [Burkholderiales bacterium]|jgi:disulfide bond formation protein DsbB|nr:disulfide bond formation protein [Burkholderiales bacterium]